MRLLLFGSQRAHDVPHLPSVFLCAAVEEVRDAGSGLLQCGGDRLAAPVERIPHRIRQASNPRVREIPRQVLLALLGVVRARGSARVSQPEPT